MKKLKFKKRVRDQNRNHRGRAKALMGMRNKLDIGLVRKPPEGMFDDSEMSLENMDNLFGFKPSLADGGVNKPTKGE